MTDIYWIWHDEPSRLAIVARPRGNDFLQTDLADLKRRGIDVLVSLLSDPEVAELGLRSEGNIAQSLGMDFVSYPIPDRKTPGDLTAFRDLVSRLSDAIQSGKRVGAHCRASIGRSTILTAAVLVDLGIPPEDALGLIRLARGYPVPDTLEQQEWIRRLQAFPRPVPPKQSEP